MFGMREALQRYGVVSLLGLLLVPGTALGSICSEPPVPGDTPKEVEAKCGAATLVSQRERQVVEIPVKGDRSVGSTGVIEWIYDRGPSEPMLSCRFENGHLTETGSPGYGRPYQDRGDACRNGELLAVGDSAVDAYLKCGLPLAREKAADRTTTELEENGTRRQTTVSVEEWTYRYGPDRPGYTLKFAEGEVKEIRPREFGK